MAATSQLAFPGELKFSSWEKDKKSGFVPDADVASQLKAFQKKHEAVNWKLFEDGWARGASNAAELQEAFALRDRQYRASVFALKKEALGIAGTAKSEEKRAAKPWLDTLKAIGKAANGYADDVDKGVDVLKAAFDAAKGALPDDEEDEESAPKALLDAKVLFKQLTVCRRDPERKMRFAFVDAKDKTQAAVLVLHPRVGARTLFSKLQTAAGVKSGAYGTAWVDGTSLMLQLDKPLSGLVKKVRGPVKACGFRIAKAVLWNEDGTVFEQDEEADEKVGADPAAGTASGVRPAPPNGPAKLATPGEAKPLGPEAAAFKARLGALVASIGAAGDTPAARQARLLGSEAGVFSRKGDWARVEALMGQAEALLRGAAKPAAGPSAPAGATSDAPAGTATATASASATTAGAQEAPMAKGTAKAPPLDAAMAFKSRLTGLVPGIRALEAVGGPVAAQVVAQREAAIALVRQKGATAAQMSEAMALLDRIDALIAGSAPGGVPKVAAATGAKVVFQQTRLEWDTTRKTVRSELQKLEHGILERCKGESDLAQIAQGTKNLYNILQVLDERLMDKLDEALNAATPQARSAFHQEARTIVDEYSDYVKSDDLFNDIDDNGFVPVAIASTLHASLAAMAQQLRSAVAA